MPDSIELGVADYLSDTRQPVGPRLRDSLLYGVQQQPDSQAKLRQASRVMDVPLFSASQDADHVKAQAAVEMLDINGMVLGSPKTAAWLADPDNAAVAHDDVQNLTGLERMIRGAKRIGTGVGERGTNLVGAIGRGLFTLTDPAADKIEDFSESLGVPTVVEWDKNGIRFRNRTQAEKDSKVGGAFTDELLSKAEDAKFGYKAGITFDEMLASPVSKFFPWAMETGVVSVPDMIGFMTSLPLYVTGRSAEIGKKRAENDSREEATVGDMLKAMPAATASALLDRIGTKGILGIEEAVAKGALGVAKETGKAAVKEGATETGQEFIEGLGEGVGTKKGVDARALGERMVQAGLAGAGFGGPVRAVGASVQATVGAHDAKVAKAQTAEQDAAQVQEMMKAAQASALRTRDSQTFKDFVDAAAQDTPVEKVYIQAQDLVDALAQGSPEALAQNTAVIQAMPSVMAQLDEALQGNSLVEIPISELLAYTPDSGLAQSLIENLKVDPNGYSMKEANEFRQSQADELKAEVEKAVTEGAAMDEFNASAERITALAKAQMGQVNRFIPGVNANYAGLLGSYYATMAARFGVTPEEMAASHPLTWQAQGVTDTSLMASAKAMTPAFKSWFGDSKVTDAKGTPRVVYHGTNQPITSFDAERGGAATGANAGATQGFWFTSSPEVASMYAENAGRVVVAGAAEHEKLMVGLQAEMKAAEKKGDWDAYEAAAQKMEDADLGAINADPITGQNVIPAYVSLQNPMEVDVKGERPSNLDELIAQAKAAGHDGLILRNVDDTPGERRITDNFVAFRPEQIKSLFNDGRYDPTSADMLRQTDQPYFSYDPGVGFQSSLFNAVLEKGANRASADQWLATLQNAPGVKKEELEWIGMADALKVMGADGAITKEQVLSYIGNNGLRLEEAILGEGPTEEDIDARAEELEREAIEGNHYEPAYYVQEIETDEGEVRWAVWYIYGHGNDVETFDTEEEAQEAADEMNLDDERDWLDSQDFRGQAERELADQGGTQYDQYQAIEGGTNYRELLLTLPRDQNPGLTRDFSARMGHWHLDNVLAHTRLADFYTPDRKRVLGVLEIQSDWHQKGRDKGYAVPASPEEQAQAQDALDKAEATRDQRGDALLDIMVPAIRARMAEMTLERDTLANQEDGLRAIKDAATAEFDRAADALNTTKPETVAPYKEAEAALTEAHNNYHNAARRRGELSDLINEGKRALTRMTYHDGDPRRGDEVSWQNAVKSLRNQAFWEGTELDLDIPALEDQAIDVTQAQLAVNEAKQKVAQASGTQGIPDAPFKAAWPALVMKRLMRMAVEQGYDHVAWATGEMQADLYDMRSHVGQMSVRPGTSEEGGQVHVRLNEGAAQAIIRAGHGVSLNDYAYDRTANGGEGEGRLSVGMTPDQVLEVFGDDLGGRLNTTANERRNMGMGDFYDLPDADVQVGGEGHKAFYNRNLVNITNGLIKKMDAKVAPMRIRATSDHSDLAYLAGRVQEFQRIIADLPPQEELEAQFRPGQQERHRRLDQLRADRMSATNRIARLTVGEEGPGMDNVEEQRRLVEEARAQVRQMDAERDAIAREGSEVATRLNARKSLAESEAELARKAPTVWGFPVTEKMRTTDAATKPNLFQGEQPSTARGAFTPSTNTITLLRNADLSTTLHELGHFFLETTARLAVDPTAPPELKNDWATLATFMGFNGIKPDAWLAIPVDGRRDGHEKFARGFELYLREGKAPSSALKGAFQRFKSWLVHIYQSVAQLNVEISDEVRGVFDRMLATDAQIAEAERARSFAPVFATRPEGMTDAEWESYQKLGAEATADAQEELTGRSMRDMQWLANTRMRMIRDLTRQAAEKRKAVKAEVESEVLSEPVYAAQQFLRRGREGWDGPSKLDKDAVAAIYEGTPAELQDWRKLGFGKYGMLSESGMDPDQAAELFGFTSGHELTEALLNADPVREVVEGRTDQRMMERYGDLKDEGAIARAADEAIHNQARLRFVATEANALAKAAGKQKVLAEAARDFARELIARQKIRDLRPAKYTGAETRAAAAAARAAAKGDLVTAASEKRNQLVNAYAAKAAYDAQDEIEKALRYLKRFESVATRKGMDPDYRDQIDAMLERFDLRTGQSLKAIDKRKSLASWITAQENLGNVPVIDEDLRNEAYRKHYRELTVEEMRGLVDAVKNIAHLGRLKNKLLVAARGRAFQAVVDEAEAAIRDNAYQTKAPRLETNTATYKLLSGFAEYGAMHRKFASMIREMSGLKKDGGILWRAFIEPMNRANDREAVMREAATMELARAFKALTVNKGELRRKLFIPEIKNSLSLEGRLAVALNWGNELNRARIMDGDKWTQPQVEAILRTLTPEHLKFVNEMWTYLDTFWPQIAAKERRVTGVEPGKVEAEPFELVAKDGTVVQMRGGYYPIKYDTERSTRSESDEVGEKVKAALRGVYARATTRRGHTKARVEKVERPVRKDLMVPFGHVNQVIHDLAFHEYLIDANRLINAPQIDAAIRDHYGVQELRQIRKVIDDMAEGDQVAEDAFERVVNHIRTGSTIVGLGWNLMSGLMQPLGLTQSLVRIGPKYMAKGIGRAFADAGTLQNSMKEIGEKSEFMRLRAKTFLREINEVQNQVQDSFKPRALTAVESTYFVLIQKLQLVADVPTWLGAYQKGLDQGHDDETAVHLADQAVRDSQGGGQLGDLAAIQRGGPMRKLWTNFYSFFNVTYNQLAESVAETRRVGASRLPLLAADVLLLTVVPAIMGELLKDVLKGEDWDDIPGNLFKAQVSYLLGMMVGLRELGMVADLGLAAAGKPTVTTNNGRGPASLRLLTSDLPQLIQQASQGEADDAFRRALLNTTGIVFHFPAGQINRTIDGLEALAKGETRNPGAIFLGAPKK